MRRFGAFFHSFWGFIGLIFSWIFCFPCKLFCNLKKSIIQTDKCNGDAQSNDEISIEAVIERRKAVRKYAENIISQYFEQTLFSPEKGANLKEKMNCTNLIGGNWSI